MILEAKFILDEFVRSTNADDEYIAEWRIKCRRCRFDRCVEAGMDRFLTKPIDRDALLAAVAQTIGVPSNESLAAKAP